MEYIAELLKDLPNCPSGRVFTCRMIGKDHGIFFHSMSDHEHITEAYHRYAFTYKEIINNPKWFKIIKEIKI